MYRPYTKPRDRLGTVAAVLLIHAGLALALLNLSGHIDLTPPEPGLQTFDVSDPEPPPPPPVIEQERPKPKDEEGAASAPNIKSKATPVVAPEPKVVVPTPSKVIATPTPNTGTDATQGAAPVAGPGTGAGGSGTGTGAGGSGSGSGGGGSGQEVRPGLVSRKLTMSDYPSGLRRAWPPGRRVLVIFNVQLNGRATDCSVHTSSGVAAIDLVTCSLVEGKMRWRPARNRRGELYVEKYAYSQAPTNF